MTNFETLLSKYRSDAPFNRVVNVHLQLLKEFGFLPSEIRDAAFLAQYLFETRRAEAEIIMIEDYEKQQLAREALQKAILDVKKIADYPMEELK